MSCDTERWAGIVGLAGAIACNAHYAVLSVSGNAWFLSWAAVFTLSAAFFWAASSLWGRSLATTGFLTVRGWALGAYWTSTPCTSYLAALCTRLGGTAVAPYCSGVVAVCKSANSTAVSDGKCYRSLFKDSSLSGLTVSIRFTFSGAAHACKRTDYTSLSWRTGDLYSPPSMVSQALSTTSTSYFKA
jgi:hypothetical protein